MASVVCTCPVSSNVSFTDGETLSFAAAATDGFCVGFYPGGTTRDIRAITAPGELGAGTKNFGAGSLMIKIKLTYVNASESDCVNNYDTDMYNLGAGTFSMLAAGRTYAGCVLKDAPPAEQPKRCGVASTYRMDAMITIEVNRP